MIHKQLGNIEIAKSLMNDFMYIDEWYKDGWN